MPSGLQTDTTGQETCWDAEVDSLGVSVPNHCYFFVSVVGPSMSPWLCTLPLILSDCSEGFLLLLRGENVTHTHTHTKVLALPSLRGQPLKNYILEEVEKKKENDNEGGGGAETAGALLGRKRMISAGRGSRNMGEGTPKAIGAK